MWAADGGEVDQADEDWWGLRVHGVRVSVEGARGPGGGGGGQVGRCYGEGVGDGLGGGVDAGGVRGVRGEGEGGSTSKL